MDMAPEPDAKADKVIFDPHGDVILEAEEKRLLVSSKVLSLASPVFAAMFKPQFKEGSNLKPEQPLVIPVPGDDSEAFILLCNVIHYRSDDTPHTPDISCLENLAFICDKYDCRGAIANSSILWLQRLIETASPEDLNKLLLVAYTLDLQENFSVISWKILLLQAGPITHLPGLSDHPLVRHDLLGKSRKI